MRRHVVEGHRSFATSPAPALPNFQRAPSRLQGVGLRLAPTKCHTADRGRGIHGEDVR